MTKEEAKSCIATIEMLQELAYNIHGVMDVIDADNCKKIIKTLEQEPCEDCVSREFMYKLGATCIATRDKNDKLIALGTIENLPSVTPTRKKGKWITKCHGFPPEPTLVCSECGFDRDFNINTRGFGKIKYCPNCGTKMEEK